MSNNLHKRQVYAGLFEIISDPKYYYRSMVGIEYSHLTNEGKDAIAEYMTVMAPHMLVKAKEEFDEKVKQKVWEELKK
jgi:hypothetical protein